MTAPNPTGEKPDICEPMQKDAALLAAKCFKLIPDQPACTSFFSTLESLQAAGCDTDGLQQRSPATP